MNKKLTAFLSLFVILAFIVYIIFDATKDADRDDADLTTSDTVYTDNWTLHGKLQITGGEPGSVAVSDDGMIFIGGDSFVRSLNPDLTDSWNLDTDAKITSLAVSGDTVYASTQETILIISTSGKLLAEWGPYEGNSIITSVTAGKNLLAIADAGNKRIFLLKKDGEMQSMMGQSGDQFVIPSPYFDVALSGNRLFTANTGHRRIETWTAEGEKLSQFGEPGTAPGAFCGCCNPAHFAVIPQGFVTAEKGINRIKILDRNGEFIEFVSSQNDFIPSIPLDVASADGKTIYAVNSVTSTLYLYKHK
jgi:hypothetical protein